MFEVFVNDFIYGTRIEVMSVERYLAVVQSWANGEHVVIDNQIIRNGNIESVYSRKVG
jgi:hypothetical protein